MTHDASQTAHLLQRWHAGDHDALKALIERDLGWIQNYVRSRLGERLRARAETVDYVHEAMSEVLRYGPRFVTTDRSRFRSLLAKIIENVLRDKHDWYSAKRRALHREKPLPSGSVLDLDAVTRPSQHAVRHEREAWVRLALELLGPEDRKVILLRQWDGLSFPEIGERMGLAPDAVRMRFHRALPRLAEKLEALRANNGSSVSAESPAE